MSHFTGKKFHDEEVLIGDKIKWYGSSETLYETFKYLAEMGFIDKELGSSKAMEEHFIVSGAPVTVNVNYLLSLNALFPETTGYRCKTRLYYMERNQKNTILNVLSGLNL